MSCVRWSRALARASRAAICGVGSGGEKASVGARARREFAMTTRGERRDGEDARTSAPSEVNPIVPSDARAKAPSRRRRSSRARSAPVLVRGCRGRRRCVLPTVEWSRITRRPCADSSWQQRRPRTTRRGCAARGGSAARMDPSARAMDTPVDITEEVLASLASPRMAAHLRESLRATGHFAPYGEIRFDGDDTQSSEDEALAAAETEAAEAEEEVLMLRALVRAIAARPPDARANADDDARRDAPDPRVVASSPTEHARVQKLVRELPARAPIPRRRSAERGVAHIREPPRERRRASRAPRAGRVRDSSPPWRRRAAMGPPPPRRPAAATSRAPAAVRAATARAVARALGDAPPTRRCRGGFRRRRVATRGGGRESWRRRRGRRRRRRDRRRRRI